jgi:hypothetical protein
MVAAMPLNDQEKPLAQEILHLVEIDEPEAILGRLASIARRKANASFPSQLDEPAARRRWRLIADALDRAIEDTQALRPRSGAQIAQPTQPAKPVDEPEPQP